MRFDKNEVEDRAIKIRQEHNIQTYGVKDIFSLIEQREIHLIRYPFGKDVLLGFSTVYEGNKVIVSNSSEILSREIFTIAHELGHILYDFEDCNQDVKIDVEISDISEDIAEERAFYFANCFLMPADQLVKYVKYVLKKRAEELTVLDIVRIQLEFNVSYSEVVKRLSDIGLIQMEHRRQLFSKDGSTSAQLFRMLDADESLLKAFDKIKVPNQYLECVTSNYEKGYIPFSSLEKAFQALGKDAAFLKKPDQNTEEDLDLAEIFEEFE